MRIVENLEDTARVFTHQTKPNVLLGLHWQAYRQ